MSKYQTKPILVDAEQLTRKIMEDYLWHSGKLPEGCHFSGASHHPGDRRIDYFSACLDVSSYGGSIRVCEGDWIVKDELGIYSVISPESFDCLYELAREGSAQ